MDAERLGPAFDSNILGRPTGRKLAGCWMEHAGVRTLVLPKVWDELTPDPEEQPGSMTAAGWIGIRNLARPPFRWVELTQDQLRLAYEIRSSFTEGCFLGVPSDRIHRHPDAVITSQALALGTDALVSGDITVNKPLRSQRHRGKAVGEQHRVRTHLRRRHHACAR